MFPLSFKIVIQLKRSSKHDKLMIKKAENSKTIRELLIKQAIIVAAKEEKKITIGMEDITLTNIEYTGEGEYTASGFATYYPNKPQSVINYGEEITNGLLEMLSTMTHKEFSGSLNQILNNLRGTTSEENETNIPNV